MAENPATIDAASARARMSEIEDSIFKSAPPELRERFYNGPAGDREGIIKIVAPEAWRSWRALFLTLEELEKHGA